jgi:hypothetical protein
MAAMQDQQRSTRWETLPRTKEEKRVQREKFRRALLRSPPPVILFFSRPDDGLDSAPAAPAGAHSTSSDAGVTGRKRRRPAAGEDGDGGRATKARAVLEWGHRMDVPDQQRPEQEEDDEAMAAYGAAEEEDDGDEEDVGEESDEAPPVRERAAMATRPVRQ